MQVLADFIFSQIPDIKFEKVQIRDQKEKNSFEIYAYCLMSNHVHMYIKETETGDIVKIMHKR